MSKDIDLKGHSIDELKDLVAAAQKEISRKQRSRIKELRNKMEQLAGTVDMTAEELLSYGGKKPKTVGEAKFRNPDNPEQTWTGRGKQPNWLKDLIAGGASKEDFAI